MTIYFSLPDKDYNYWIKSDSYYSMQNINKLINYFFPDNLKIEYTNSNDDSNNNSNDDLNNNSKHNSIIYGIQLEDNINLDTSKLNILICVENCSVYNWYKHYNKYSNFGNDKIQIYFYNHIDKCVFTDKYIAIPVIYTQINYFLKYNNNIEPSIYTNFNDKKFCLIATSLSGETKEVKNKIINKLKKIGVCDTLDMYKNEISNKSCYHSIELLNIFNKYKFVFVCENSLGIGYITEKIFNCLFARCIPIYYGCSTIENYIDKDCFINMNLDNEINNEIINLKNNEIINILKNNELKYNNKITANKICKDYNDENYKDKLKEFVDKYFMK
jgi:hypothetical protein